VKLKYDNTMAKIWIHTKDVLILSLLKNENIVYFEQKICQYDGNYMDIYTKDVLIRYHLIHN